MVMCARCKKNMAVVFVTRVENGKTKSEGLCLKCARELGVDLSKSMEAMGVSPEEIDKFARFVHEERGLLVGWYSGRDKISELIDVRNFDFIKIGHYDEKLGGLNYASTNQIMYKVEHYKEGFDLTNITERFWKKKI